MHIYNQNWFKSLFIFREGHLALLRKTSGMGRLSMASYIPQLNFASLPVGPARIRARCHHASSELASAVSVKGLAPRSIKKLLEFPTFWQMLCFFPEESGWAKGALFGATPECSRVSTPLPPRSRVDPLGKKQEWRIVSGERVV